jgi:hypothetical protein
MPVKEKSSFDEVVEWLKDNWDKTDSKSKSEMKKN